MADVRVTVLDDHGDRRGSSYAPDAGWAGFLGSPCDMHVTTILPGYVRGNHYHPERKEVLVVISHGQWLFRWDNGPDTPVQERLFPDAGVVLLEVEPQAAHALKNTGDQVISVVSLCDRVYDPGSPDVVLKRLVD